RAFADVQIVVAPGILDDRVVDLIPGDPDRMIDDDAAQGNDGDFGRAAADVDDHGADRFFDREARPDRGRHRFFDRVGFARPGRERRVFGGPFFDFGDAGGNADDDAGMGSQEALQMDLADEVMEHHLDGVEIGDDAVFERTDGDDAFRGLADHRLGFGPDAEGAAGAGVDRHHARLGNDDPFPPHVDQRVGSAEVDAQVTAEEAEESREGPDQSVGPPRSTASGDDVGSRAPVWRTGRQAAPSFVAAERVGWRRTEYSMARASHKQQQATLAP